MKKRRASHVLTKESCFNTHLNATTNPCEASQPAAANVMTGVLVRLSVEIKER